MFNISVLLLLISYIVEGTAEDVTVDLLKVDFAGDKDVERRKDIVSFGSKTKDLFIDKHLMKNFRKYSTSYKQMAFFAVAKFTELDFGESTLIILKSPLSTRTYFKVSIQKKLFQNSMEGTISSLVEKVKFNIAFVYSSGGHEVKKRIPISDKFNPNEWFKLAVRLIGDSEVQISFNCKVLENVKLQRPMDPPPKYLEGRLAHSIERDIWTLLSVTSQRFIGEMRQAMFVFGEKSYRSLNPCNSYQRFGMVMEGGIDEMHDVIQNMNANPGQLGNVDIFYHSNCMYKWILYEHGEEWREGPCQLCKCTRGQTKCSWIENCGDPKRP